MREVQAKEAQTRLAEFLWIVESGEKIAITRHGRTVAHLVPAAAKGCLNRAQVVEQFRQRRAN